MSFSNKHGDSEIQFTGRLKSNDDIYMSLLTDEKKKKEADWGNETIYLDNLISVKIELDEVQASNKLDILALRFKLLLLKICPHYRSKSIPPAAVIKERFLSGVEWIPYTLVYPRNTLIARQTHLRR